VKKYLLPTLGDIFFISLFTAILVFGPRTFNLDGDLGRHITIGNFILNNLEIPRTDIFSHTMLGQPLTPHEWLAQVAFALAHRGLSLAGAVFLTALVVAVSFSLVFHESVKRSAMPFLALLITLLAAAASSLHWLARPHVFTFLYLAVWVLLLERVRTNKKADFWMFGIIMLLWANTHGAFIAGFVTWGAYVIGEILDSWVLGKWEMARLKKWGLLGTISMSVTLINPAGIHLWGTSFEFLGNHYLLSHTQEYLPPDFHHPGTWPFLLMIGLSVLILGMKKNRPPFTHILLLTGWTVMALYSARNIPLFAIIGAPILSEMVSGLTSGLKCWWNKLETTILTIEQSLRSGVWIAVSVPLAIIALSMPSMQAYNTFDASVFPVNAVNWLESHPQDGNVFNHFPWGGYLLYRQWPERLVFIDGQTDFYGEALTREYEQIISTSQGWETILDKNKIRWVIIPFKSNLANVLIGKGWEALYQDETAIILRVKQLNRDESETLHE
jgi:hypothetical protein